MATNDIDFSYDGDDEEIKRNASEPKKHKFIKQKHLKKEEIETPKIIPIEQPPDITPTVTPPIDVTQNLDNPEKQVAKETIAVIAKTPIKNEDSISTPVVVAAAVATAGIASVASKFIKSKAKINKQKHKNNSDNNKKEEKKKEEEKKCNSRSDKVASLIEETNKQLTSSKINNVKIEEDKKLKEKMAALHLEFSLLNKQIKKLEEKIEKKNRKKK